jgi:hypothetical protein
VRSETKIKARFAGRIDGDIFWLQYFVDIFCPSTKYLTLSRLGPCLDHVLSLATHISPNNGPINMVLLAKLIHYVLPLHIACLIIQIGPLVAKLQHVTGMRGG